MIPKNVGNSFPQNFIKSMNRENQLSQIISKIHKLRNFNSCNSRHWPSGKLFLWLFKGRALLKPTRKQKTVITNFRYKMVTTCLTTCISNIKIRKMSNLEKKNRLYFSYMKMTKTSNFGLVISWGGKPWKLLFYTRCSSSNRQHDLH